MPHMTTSTIKRVRDLVTSGEMTKAGLARAAGLHANTLRDAAESEWNPTAETLAKLEAFLADKGYDADAIRADLANRNIEAVIPGRSNRRVKIEYDRAFYKERNQIERFSGRLKINRAIVTRYDQLAESFLFMVHVASARYPTKFVHAA